MPRDATRVGGLLLAALAVAAVGIFFIGKESNLFSRKNEYYIRFQSVGGLKSGNPVQLNGVDVGQVERVFLPKDPDQSTIQVWISVDRRYEERVREDSQARIKTLGLLGDKFIEITSGSPDFAVIPADEEIPAAPATDVDALLASGEDTMTNVVAISASLKTILERMEKGEGLLGQLTANTPEGERFSESVVRTMETVERVANQIEKGDGPIGHLLNDRAMTAKIDSVVTRLDRVLAKAEEGEGLLPALLDDAATKERFDTLLSELSDTSTDLSGFVERVESSEGLLQKLLTDEDYAREVSGHLERLLERLESVAAELDEGDGTAARLIHDPAIYDAVNDIVVGINESKLLRWLIRNRQKKGIEKRYDDAQQSGATPGGTAAAPAEPEPAEELIPAAEEPAPAADPASEPAPSEAPADDPPPGTPTAPPAPSSDGGEPPALAG